MGPPSTRHVTAGPPHRSLLHNHMSVEAELVQLQAEIAALDAEVKSLQHTHDAAYRETLTAEAHSRSRKLSKPSVSAPPPGPPRDADEAPALIHHEYFDPSISKYFTEAAAPPDPALQPQRILETILLKTTAGHVALTESIMRFGGITAFPINHHLYDPQADALLGLRFDVLALRQARFVTPHYIILRRGISAGKDGGRAESWQVFRYTTPVYVPLDQYLVHLQDEDEADGLQRFVEKVRRCLVHVQSKHELLDRVQECTMAEALASLPALPIVSVSRDLQCHRVTLTFNNSSCKVEMICSEVRVDSCSVAGGDESQCLTIMAMLGGTALDDLVGMLYKIVRYMHEQGLFRPW